jgi:hypothetical protein
MCENLENLKGTLSKASQSASKSVLSAISGAFQTHNGEAPRSLPSKYSFPMTPIVCLLLENKGSEEFDRKACSKYKYLSIYSMRLEGGFSWILALHTIAILLLTFKDRLSGVEPCLSMLL